MKSYVKLPKNKFYIILIFCSILIFSISLETMIKVKDVGLFKKWMISSKEIINETLSYEEYFNTYLIMNLSMLFLKSVIPMALSIHSYFSFTYIRINKLFVFIWTVLLLGGLSYNIVELNICSIFFYINIISYIILIINILSLGKVINNN